MKEVMISDYLWFQEGPGVRNTQYTTSGVKLINVANLVDGNLDLSTSDRYISEEEAYGKYNHFLADDGDFVIASSGIKIDYFDKKMGFVKKDHLPLCMNTSCIRFKVLDSSNLEIKYFMYYLKSNSFKKQLFNQITGSAQLNFGPSHLKKMTFPLIDLNEQKRIIERLDKTQNIINETKALLSKYDTLIKSRFIEMFGDPVINEKDWEKKRLENVCNVIVDCPHSTPNYTNENTGFMCIRTSIIRPTGLNWDEIEFISEKEFYQRISRRKPCIGDIVYLREGGILGIAAIINRDVNVALGQRTMLLSPNYDICNSIYICETMNMKSFFNKALEKMGGSASPHINVADIKTFPIPVPPLTLQNDFAAFVQQIDKSKFEIANSLKRVYNKWMLSK